MEASVVERALENSPALDQGAARHAYGVLLPLLFLGSVLAMYVGSGYAIYALIAALI